MREMGRGGGNKSISKIGPLHGILRGLPRCQWYVPRVDGDSRDLSTQQLPRLALHQGVRPEREAAGTRTATKKDGRPGAGQPNSGPSSLLPRAQRCELSLPLTRIKDVPGGLATPSSQVRPWEGD